MNFRIGDAVYIGYAPDHRCRTAKFARCSIGEIISGPYSPEDIYRLRRRKFRDRAWGVSIDGHSSVFAAERVLTRFRPPDEDESTTRRKEVAA